MSQETIQAQSWYHGLKTRRFAKCIIQQIICIKLFVQIICIKIIPKVEMSFHPGETILAVMEELQNIMENQEMVLK